MGTTTIAMALVLALSFSSPVIANDHGGGGHGEKKEEKKVYPAYSATGSDQCKTPKAHKKATPECGSEEYRAYVAAVEAYNACVESYDNKTFLPLRSCHPKKRKKSGPDYRKLLDPPG